MPGAIQAGKHLPATESGRDVVTLLALFAFGAVKGRLTGIKPLVGGLQTVGIGGFAAAVAIGIARWIG